MDPVGLPAKVRAWFKELKDLELKSEEPFPDFRWGGEEYESLT